MEGRESADGSHACNECRRRKARCSRELPVCSQCLQYGRHCLYERHSRTPLTRKHLTQVEESLRIATEIIRDRLPDVDIARELQHARYEAVVETKHPTADSNDAQALEWVGRKRPRSASVDTSGAAPEPDPRRYSDLVESELLDSCVERVDSPPEEGDTLVSTDVPPNLSLDNPSMYGLDYDWDERDDGLSACTDGMGALSIQHERSGYLGLASGASLLHLIHSYSSDPFSSITTFPTAPAQPSTMSTPVDLPKEISAQKIEGYIADYFNQYHVSYPLVHQSLFMAQYHEIVPRPRNGWMALMYVVAAIGAFMGATNPNNDDLFLFRLARSHLSVEMLEVGNLTLLQALSLISNYLQKRDRPNSSYNYLGLAVRMAFGLGLHKELPKSNGNALYMEIRRRTWWCLYIFDVGSTITFSRPVAIPSATLNARLPLNIIDSDLTASTVSAPQSATCPTIYTNVRVQSKFHLLTNALYNRVISKPFPSAQQVLTWDDFYIVKWLTSVPSYYTESATVPDRYKLAHAIMIWRYKHFRMIIYRPFLVQQALMSSRQAHGADSNDQSAFNADNTEFSSAPTMEACERCLKESHDTVQHIDRFWSQQPRNRMVCWYALYFLFSATLVPVISLRNNPRSPRAEQWREDIRTATRVIKEMKELSTFAERCSETLERLVRYYISPIAPKREDTLASYAELLTKPVDETVADQILSMQPMLWPEVGLGSEDQFWTDEDFAFLQNSTGAYDTST